VYIFEKGLEFIVLIECKNTAHPNFSGKNDKAQSPSCLIKCVISCVLSITLFAPGLD